MNLGALDLAAANKTVRSVIDSNECAANLKAVLFEVNGNDKPVLAIASSNLIMKTIYPKSLHVQYLDVATFVVMLATVEKVWNTKFGIFKINCQEGVVWQFDASERKAFVTTTLDSLKNEYQRMLLLKCG